MLNGLNQVKGFELRLNRVNIVNMHIHRFLHCQAAPVTEFLFFYESRDSHARMSSHPSVGYKRG